MKIRHPWLTSLIGRAGAWLIHLWMSTLRVRVHVPRATIDFLRPDCDGNYIYTLWHDVLLLPTHYFRKSHQYTLISQSQDGEYIARVASGLGWNVIRGSTSRGASTALRQLLSVARGRARVHLAITADGPRGPRHVLQNGVIYLASRSGLAIVPIGVAHDRPWRARSWDRFVLPRPFRRAVIVASAEIVVPPDLTRCQIDAYRQLVQARMDQCERAAEESLDTGRAPSLPPMPRLTAAA